MFVYLNVASIFFNCNKNWCGLAVFFCKFTSSRKSVQKLLNCYVHTDGWTAISIGAQW